MDRRRKVELFEEIRREYRFGVGTIQGVARKLGVHRRMVRQALASAVPPERKIPARRKPRLEPVIEFIDEILRTDQQVPRKQRHTAHRIWERIREERSEVTVAEATVRRYVQYRKEELGMAARETFVPQTYDWGQEAQVDWYEAFAEVLGECRKVYVFSMRSMAGGGAFRRAYYHATQQAFLEAHEFAFRYFGGVFRRLRYDNLKSAVKKILSLRANDSAWHNTPHLMRLYRPHSLCPDISDRVAAEALDRAVAENLADAECALPLLQLSAALCTPRNRIRTLSAANLNQVSGVGAIHQV